MLKKHERILTIDGEYINLVAAEGKNFFDIGRSSNSFHASTVTTCKKTGGNRSSFRMIASGKQFDLEANSEAEASKHIFYNIVDEICNLIQHISRMIKTGV